MYERHKRLSQELDALLPRGPKGHPQNVLREVFYDSRLNGMPFRESFDVALAFVRKTHPDFMPNLRLSPLP